MKAAFLFGLLPWILFGCNAAKTSSVNKESIDLLSNKRQIESQEEVIYFRAAGNEPFWSLKISDSGFQFSYFTSKVQTFTAPTVAPILGQDANVKLYRIVTESGQMNIQITQSDCKDSMTGVLSPYTVVVELKLGSAPIYTTYKGCGEYITDARLHNTWVLETMNAKSITNNDFSMGFPRLEINTKSNHFYGFAGCNGMSGSLFFENEVLRFAKIATTRKMCQTQNKETDFITLLQSTTSYQISNNRLTLKNISGDELVFKKED